MLLQKMALSRQQSQHDSWPSQKILNVVVETFQYQAPHHHLNPLLLMSVKEDHHTDEG